MPRGWLQDVPEIAAPAKGGGLGSYAPDRCAVTECELPARYRGYCFTHWREAKVTEETKAPALPEADQTTEDQMREAINGAQSNSAAMRALGMPAGSGDRLANLCSRLGVELPAVRLVDAYRAQKRPATRTPRMSPKHTETPFSAQVKADAAERRTEQTATYPLSAVAEPEPAPAAPAGDPKPTPPGEMAVRKIAALQGILQTLDVLGDLAAAHQVIGSVAILLGCDVHHDRNW